MQPTIRPETPLDREAIERVHRQAFGRTAEAELVNALREGGYARVSLVAEAAGEVIGHVLFHAVEIKDGASTVEALSLAPLAVLPEHQRQGVGSRLVQAGLEACRAQGGQWVFVLGEPAYYGRFGFSAELGARVASPYAGAAFMALELTPGAMDRIRGEVRYPPPFSELE